MTISTTMGNKLLSLIKNILLPLVFFLALYWLVAVLVKNPLILPEPPAIVGALLSLLLTADYWMALLMTLLRVLLGLFLGTAVGALLGASLFLVPGIGSLVRPLLTVIRATPVASFVVLAWSFTGSHLLPVLIATLMVIPIVADALVRGLSAQDSELLEVAELYSLSPWRRFCVLRFPAALPHFMGAVSSSMGFAWKAGIAAEVLVATARSIGKEVYYAKLYLETPALWAYTLTIVAVSILLEFLVKKTLLLKEGRGEACRP